MAAVGHAAGTLSGATRPYVFSFSQKKWPITLTVTYGHGIIPRRLFAALFQVRTNRYLRLNPRQRQPSYRLLRAEPVSALPDQRCLGG